MRKAVAVLDAPLLRLSPLDTYDIRAACSQLLILGTTGSGKSSTSYKHAVLAALKANAGALFCVAKPEDAEAIRAYCAEAGRLPSLIDWNPSQGGLNVLAYQLARTGSINDVIDLLMAMFEIVKTSGANVGKAGDQFWTDSAAQMLKAAVPIVYAATGTVRIRDLLAFLRSAPTSLEQVNSPEWRATSIFWQMVDAAAKRLLAGPIRGFDADDGMRALAYWTEFCALDAKTAGNIRVSVTTLLSRFETGILRDALCGESSIFLEAMFSGAIILLNFPVQVYGADGAILQKTVKHLAQKVILTRNAMPQPMRILPILIGADECQNFLFRDAEFLAECRSSLTMVVMATQSLPTLYSKIGGDHPHDQAHYFASAFNNVVLHSSACGETNEWFAKKLGRTVHLRQNFSRGEGGGQNFGMSMGEGTNWGTNSSSGSSSSHSSNGGSSYGSQSSMGSSAGGSDNWGRNRGSNTSWNSGQGWSEQSDWVIEPGFFARGLKTGGTAHNGRVTAIWFRAGACFAATNSNFLMVEYRQ